MVYGSPLREINHAYGTLSLELIDIVLGKYEGSEPQALFQKEARAFLFYNTQNKLCRKS